MLRLWLNYYNGYELRQYYALFLLFTCRYAFLSPVVIRHATDNKVRFIYSIRNYFTVLQMFER